MSARRCSTCLYPLAIDECGPDCESCVVTAQVVTRCKGEMDEAYDASVDAGLVDRFRDWRF